MVTRRRNALQIAALALAASTALISTSSAQTVWDGGAGAGDGSWGTAANWNNDTLPAFNGTDILNITAVNPGAPFTAGTGPFPATSLSLGGNRSISKLAFGGGTTALSLGSAADTLTLTGTSTGTAGVATAVWLANTADNFAATVNANLLFDRGSAGSYSAYIRENANSNGGTTFNGTITQGAGQSVTLSFSQGSSRGEFRLNNASNSFAGLTNTGTTVRSLTPGSFGGAALTLSGGNTGTQTAEHWTTPVANSVNVTAASSFSGLASTRLTGPLTQAGVVLTYASAASTVVRLEYSSTSFNANSDTQLGGSSATTNTTLAASSMSQIGGRNLLLGAGTNTPGGVFVLTGLSTGGDVPTWAQFEAARTYNQASATGSWKINVPVGDDTNGAAFGGFAARGADLTIPASFAYTTGGGSTTINDVFTRNFQLGSAALQGGTPYADKAVTLQTPISYGSLAAGSERFFSIAANHSTSRGTTTWTLGGPVHELAGAITGDNVNLYMLSLGLSATAGATPGPGLVRISNTSNSLTGASRILLGVARSTVTMTDAYVSSLANQGDSTSGVMIFTSDAAFGGASLVEVGSRASSGTSTAGLLLLEDQNGSGTTSFARNFAVVNTSAAFSSGYGSYAGDVVYTGTITHAGTQSNTIVHVQSGTLDLNGATLTNNRTGVLTQNVLNKGGAGQLIVSNVSYNGTNTFNQWQVRAGTLSYNDTSNDSFTDFDVAAGATLGGSGSFTVSGTSTINMAGTLAPGNSAGTLDVTVTSLDFVSGASYVVELGGTSPGDGTGFYDQTNVSGRIALSGTVSLGVTLIDGYAPVAGDTFYILTRGATGTLTNTAGNAGTLGSPTGLFAGLPEGTSFFLGGKEFKITYLADWTGSQAGSSLTGGNDVALTVVPEPATLGMLAGVATLVLGRRRGR